MQAMAYRLRCVAAASMTTFTTRPSCSWSTRRRGKAMGYGIPMTRRNFVRTGTAAAGTILLGTAIRRSGPAPAGARTSAPPTVDRVAVRVVVDSYQDALVRTARVGEVEVQRFGVVSGAGLGKHVHNAFGL